MRFSLVQLCLIVLSVTAVMAHEVNAQEILDQPLSIKLDNENLKTAVRAIEKAADVTFSYRKGLLKNDKKITFEARNEKLSVVLTSILENTNIEYEVLGQQIILTKVKKLSQAPPLFAESR